MNLLIVTNDANDAIISRLPFANYINKSGLGNCDVLVLNNFDESIQEIIVEKFSLNGLFNVRRRIKKERYTHVIIRGVKLSLFAIFLISRNQSLIFYITGLGRMWGQRKTVKSGLFRILFKFYLSQAIKIFNARLWVQNSDDLYDLAIDATIINGSGIAIPDYFEPAQKLCNVVYAGRLMYSKGFLDLLEFAEESSGSDFKLIVCGTFSEEIKIPDREKFNSLADAGIIHYLGYVKDISTVLKDCAFAFYPTYYREGTPRFVLEGLALGLIPIIPNSPGCRLLLSQGRAIEYKGITETLKQINSLTLVTYKEWARINYLFAQEVYKDKIIYDSMIKAIRRA